MSPQSIIRKDLDENFRSRDAPCFGKNCPDGQGEIVPSTEPRGESLINTDDLKIIAAMGEGFRQRDKLLR